MSQLPAPADTSIAAAAPEVIALHEIETPPKRPVLGIVLAVLVMILFLAGIAGWKYHQISQAIAMGKAYKAPPEAITTIKVAKETVSPLLESVGSLSSPQGVMLSADLPGTVSAILFESGSKATNAQILVQLDTRQEEAQLATAAAKLELARQNLDRAKDLAGKHVIAPSAYDEAKSQYDAAVASVDETRAMIGRKTLRAPFSGDLGIRRINAGQYLKSGDPIVQLESLDPIYVDFAVPQQEIGSLAVGRKIRLLADGLPGKPFAGNITAINSAVDAATRNIQVQATVPNPDHLLRSGMFAGVQVELPDKHDAIMVPSTAVQYAPYGDSVFVITLMKDKDGNEYSGAREQMVTLGKARGDQVEILKGLSDGEEIATSGIFKLRQGAAVKVNNSVQPGNNPAPKPQDS